MLEVLDKEIQIAKENSNANSAESSPHQTPTEHTLECIIKKVLCVPPPKQTIKYVIFSQLISEKTHK